MKLKFKILILLLTVSLLPFITISYTLIERTAFELEKKAENSILNLVKAKTENYNTQFEILRKEIETGAEVIGKEWGKWESKANMSYIWVSPDNKIRKQHIEELKNFEMVMDVILGIVNRNEKVSLAYFGTEKGVCFISDVKTVEKLKEIKYFEHRERKWYVEAIKSNRSVWTEYIDVNTGDITLSISKAVSNNGLIGVLSLDLPLQTIKKNILDIKFEGSGYSLLVNRNGYIWVHPEYTAAGKKWNESFEGENIFNISGLKEIGSEVKNGSTGFKMIYLTGKKHYAFFSPLNEINGSLVFILPESVVIKGIEEERNKMILIAIFISIGIAIISIIFSDHITKPLEKLQKATREVAKGNFDYKVDVSGKDEVANLSYDFNRMIEEIKNSRKKLEESEKRYRGVFEESTDVIYISTPDGRLIDINKAGERLFGYSREELLNMNVVNLYERKEDREKFKKDIEEKGMVKDYEVKLKRKDGKTLYCLLSTVMINKGDKTFYQGIIRDITAIKEAKKQLEMYNTLLRHDITNKIQIILSSLELIKYADTEEEKKKLIEKAYENVVQAQQLLQKLSIIMKAENIETKEIDLKDALMKSITKYEHFAYEKGIKIKYNIKDGCVIANELLENVFSNLIENAIYHSKCKNIEIDVIEEKEKFVIRIKDDGVGIPKEIKNKIFEPGVKGKESKGSGLGLHLVKTIVEGYGGKIIFKEDGGTTFEIHLRKCSLMG